MMSRKDVATAVREQLALCAGWDQDEVSKQREQALDYYFMRPRGDEVAGRSQVVSGDLSAMTEANLSQMLDAFTTDNIVEFEPDGQEDETQAQLESDVVSHFVMKANHGYWEFGSAIKDGLLMRLGIMKVWVEDSEQTRVREYVNVEPEAKSELLNRPGEIVEELEYRTADKYLKLRSTFQRRELRVEAIPPENFLYWKNWHSTDLQRIPICAERHTDSRSTLKELFPKAAAAIDEIGANLNETNDETSNARNPQKYNAVRQASEPSQDQIEWFEAFMLIDTDGDGISERRRICVAGEKILSDEPVDFVSYAAGSVFINPHRLLGVSLYDKLKQIQDISTGLNRALLDNANATNKSRTAYLDGKVDVDDLDSGMVNGNIRVRPGVGVVSNALMAFQVPDISAGILQNLQYQANVRSEMGGAALDLASGQAQLGSDRVGSQGLDRAYSVMEQLAAHMTKNMAQSLIRNTYLLAHATLRRYFDAPTNIKLHGKWMEPTPSQWQERSRVEVKVGKSVGERRREQDALSTVLDRQLQLMQAGEHETLVNITGFHNALLDWCRVADLQNPEQYWVDPASDESKAAADRKAKQAQQAAQQRLALMNQAVGIENLKIAMSKYEHDTGLRFKYWETLITEGIEEAKIVGKAVAEMEAERGKTDEPAEA